MSGPRWMATGWLCATGMTIELSLFLPAGGAGKVERKKPCLWQYSIRRVNWDKPTGRYKTKTAAMRACETELMGELKCAIRILSKPDARAA